MSEYYTMSEYYYGAPCSTSTNARTTIRYTPDWGFKIVKEENKWDREENYFKEERNEDRS